MAGQDEQLQRARQHVRKLRGFYIHLLVYLVVNVVLVVVNLVVGRPIWFFWATVGWGIGLLAHGLGIGRWKFLGKEWEERETREYLDREKKDGQ